MQRLADRKPARIMWDTQLRSFIMPIVFVVVLAFVAGVLVHRYLSRARADATASPQPQSQHESNATAASFDTMVIKASSQTPVLVDFHAAWCQPCQYLGPLLAGMAKDYAGNFMLVKVDVDAEASLAQTYNIRSMPTVLLFRDGRSVDQFVGARPAHSVRFFLAQNGVMPPQEMTRPT
ncbi:MAG: hypothetical protein RLZZ584_2753 [Pseudomonadota bacterium]